MVIAPTDTLGFKGSVLINKTVMICFRFVSFAVVRRVPYGTIELSVADNGPRTVELNSHQVHPLTDATRITPHAYLLGTQFLSWDAKVESAEDKLESSLPRGIFQ